MPEDMALSRDHFMIEINPPQCELRDLGSTNGTFVNNQRVDRVRLVSGDMIAAGQSVFRVGVKAARACPRADDAAREAVAPGSSDGRPRFAAPVVELSGTSKPDDRRPAGWRLDRSGGVVVCAVPVGGRVVASAGPVLYNPARAGPRCNGRGLPGAAQSDR